METSRFEVTEAGIGAYLAATGEDRSRVEGRGALDASPLFPTVATWDVLFAAVQAEMAAATGVAAVILSRHHAEIVRACVAGETVMTRAEVTARGRIPGGVLVQFAHDTEAADGETIAHQRTTLLFAGMAGGEENKALVREGARVGAGAESSATAHLDDDVTVRYAAASGDHNPIHLDPSVGIAAGLPGVIVHGMCVLAHAARAIVDLAAGGDPARLAEIGCQFARPVLPGQDLTTVVWRPDAPTVDGEVGFRCETVDGTVVKRARALLRP